MSPSEPDLPEPRSAGAAVTTPAAATRGCFITIEGIDGAGKSSHVDWMCAQIEAQGRRVRRTREPGGTELGERLRELLLNTRMHIDTETLLMFAARAEHLHQVIEPALQAGVWVVCDRFTDATFAYQGGGRGMGAARIAPLETWVQQGRQPDLTLLFDLPVAVALERVARRAEATQTAPDRFEQEQQAFFERVQGAYRQRADADPKRFCQLDGCLPIDTIRQHIEKSLEELFARY